MELVALGSGEVEPTLRRRERRSQPSGVGRGRAQPSGVEQGGAYDLSVHRGGANPRGSDEAKPLALVVGRGSAQQEVVVLLTARMNQR